MLFETLAFLAQSVGEPQDGNRCDKAREARRQIGIADVQSPLDRIEPWKDAKPKERHADESQEQGDDFVQLPHGGVASLRSSANRRSTASYASAKRPGWYALMRSRAAGSVVRSGSLPAGRRRRRS